MEEKLIEAVRFRKVLYDTSHEDYLKTKLKAEKWKEVAKETDIRNDSRVQQTARSQQPPEVVSMTQQDDPMETEPSPPLVLPMELEPPTQQQSPPSVPGSWQQEVDAYPSGRLPGDVFARAQAGWRGTTGSL
ncbi:uncharacterized protein LOC126248820 [Schistocerca nitens]|uniref:uncharacterized protein LOC126248820 n=1 Tax=Schistocerca nitens TaxID=7011 RepID=UPI002118A4AE|nr:uncharacterized protein LOC126248820 [Schistocerca nitens]